MNRLWNFLLLTLCSLGPLACGYDVATNNREGSEGNAMPVQAQPIVREKNANTPIGKPSMAVELKHHEYVMPADSSAELTVELISGLSDGDLSVQVVGDEGLSVVQGALHSVSPVVAGQIPLKVGLVSTGPGKYFLTLRLNHRAEQVAFPQKVVKVIVWVGGKPEVSVQKQQNFPDKVVLPAQETIN